MSHKSKGIGAERELVHLFWNAGWGAIRVAGSGSTKYPSPDLLAGNGVRRVAVECKAMAAPIIYLEKREVQELRIFAQKMAAEPWIGARFTSHHWLFVGMEELEETEKSFAVNRKTAELRGLTFEELIGQ